MTATDPAIPDGPGTGPTAPAAEPGTAAAAVTPDTDAQLASRLRLAVGRLHRRIRLAGNDIPPLQLSTLASIEKHGPLRLGELAQREAVSAPTLSRVLAALDQRGLIVRTANPADARSTRVALSSAGVRVLDEVRSQRTALLDARLARLSPEQRAALVAALPALEMLVHEEC
jgi:DNA-binding MarR family transcriptional regulator